MNQHYVAFGNGTANSAPSSTTRSVGQPPPAPTSIVVPSQSSVDQASTKTDSNRALGDESVSCTQPTTRQDSEDEEEEEEETEEAASGVEVQTESDADTKEHTATVTVAPLVVIDKENPDACIPEEHSEVATIRTALFLSFDLLDTDSEGRATMLSVEPILRTQGFKDGDLNAVLPERMNRIKDKHPTIKIEEVVQRTLVIIFGPTLNDSLSSIDGTPPAVPGQSKRRDLVKSIMKVDLLREHSKDKGEVEVKRNLLDARLAAVMGNKRRIWSDGLARRWWDTIHLFTIVFLLIATSYFTYFTRATDELWLVVASYVIHAFYAADIVLSTQLAGFDHSANQLVLQVKEIIKLRRESLTLDLVTVLPIDTIISHFFPVPPGSQVSVDAWGTEPIFIVFQIFRWVQWVKFFRCFSLFEFTNVDFITPGHVDFFIKNRPLLIGGGVSLLLMHFLICIYALTHPLRGAAYWMALIDTLSMITGSGPGVDIETTWAAQALGIVLIVLAVLVQGLVIGQMSVIVFRADVKSANVQRMRETLAILEHYRVPQDTMREVLSYQMHALNDDADKTQSVLQGLPDAMRREIVIYVKVDAIQRVSLFNSASADCKIYLAKQLQRCIAPPLDDIVSIGDLGDEMFTISHGDADVIIVTGLTVATLSRGDYFGEIALVTEQCTRQATVRALSYCDLWALSRAPFMDAVMKFPLLCEIVVEHMGTKKIDPEYFIKQVDEARTLDPGKSEAPFPESEDEKRDEDEETKATEEEIHAVPSVPSVMRSSLTRKPSAPSMRKEPPTAGEKIAALGLADRSLEEDPEIVAAESMNTEENPVKKSHSANIVDGPLGVESGVPPGNSTTGSLAETSAHSEVSSLGGSTELRTLMRGKSAAGNSKVHRLGNPSRGGDQGAFSVLATQRGARVNTANPWGATVVSPEGDGASPIGDTDMPMLAADELEEENRELKAEVSLLESRVQELLGYIDFFERDIYGLSQALLEKSAVKSVAAKGCEPPAQLLANRTASLIAAHQGKAPPAGASTSSEEK